MFGSDLPPCPSEILNAVFCALKSSSASSEELLSCALVSRAWYDVALPHLYSNVVLNGRNIERFHRNWKLTTRHHLLVRSVTIRAGFLPSEEALISFDTRGGTNRTSATGRDSLAILSGELDGIPKLLGEMQRLNSFSFIVSSSVDASLQLRRSTIGALVAALPKSCANLEIDTACRDTCPRTLSGDLCEIIRETLPRMQHVRLRLGYLCSELLVEGRVKQRAGSSVSDGLPASGENKPDDSDSAHLTQLTLPTKFPMLKALVISLLNPIDDHYLTTVFPRHCTHYHNDVESPRPTAWSSLMNCIQPDDSPASDSTTRSRDPWIRFTWNVCDFSLTHAPDFVAIEGPPVSSRYYTTVAEADPIQFTTRMHPYRCLPPETPEYLLFRDPEHNEWVTNRTKLEAYVEGQTWCTVLGGSRLPQDIIWAGDRDASMLTAGCVGIDWPLLSRRDYKALSGSSRCSLWDNEDATGMRLLEGAVVEGDEYWEEGRLICEQTPPGWVRFENERYARVHRVE